MSAFTASSERSDSESTVSTMACSENIQPREGMSDASQELMMGLSIKARLVYLSGNLFFMVLNVLYGIWVWESTQSLTIEVDLLSEACTLTAILINIAVELIKPRMTSMRNVVMADLIGGSLSLSLLALVGYIGIIDAMEAGEALKEHHSSPTKHVEKLFQYGLFATSLSIANLTIFGALSNLMLPKTGSEHDQLNILSNLAHSTIDLVTNGAVLVTSLYLQYGVPKETLRDWLSMVRRRTTADIIGSLMICACVLISIIVLLRDIWHAVQWLRETADDKEETEKEKGHGFIANGETKVV